MADHLHQQRDVHNIMTKIEQIFYGWAMLSFKHLGYKPSKEQSLMAEKRLLICDECEFRTNNKCKLCGCNLAAKTLVKNSECPKNKWEN